MALLVGLAWLAPAAAQQSACGVDDPFTVSPERTFCVDTSGNVEIAFTLFHLTPQTAGDYTITFPDGRDTTFTNVAANVDVSYTFPFTCSNPTGGPELPTASDPFYSYKSQLTIVRTDCVDDEGRPKRGAFAFNVVPNPIKDIVFSDLSCRSAPYLIDLDALLCSEELIKTFQWYLDGRPIRRADQRQVKDVVITTPGSHVIQLDVTTYSDKCETFSFEKPITITAAPTVEIDYTLNNADLCSTQIEFPVYTTYQHVETFSWSSPSPDVSFSDPSVPSPVITINNETPGTRRITLLAGNEGCGNTSKTFEITTYVGQTIDRLSPLVTCSGTPYTFCDQLEFTPEPASIMWSSDGDGVSISGADTQCPEVTFQQPGRYTLTASGTDACGLAYSVPVDVTVRDGAPLQFDFSTVDTLCPSEPPLELLDYVSNAENVSSIAGSGVVGTTFDVSNLRGEVSVRITDSCGVVYPIDFFVLTPGTFAGGNPTICRGATLDLSAIQQGSYSGTGVSGNIFSSADLEPGSYLIQYRSTDYCGGQGNFTIRVEETTVAGFDFAAEGCDRDAEVPVFAVNEAVTLSSTANAPVTCYRIVETGQRVCNQDSATFTFSSPGRYTLQQTVGFVGGACQDSLRRPIEVIAPFSLSAAVTIDSNDCDSLTLTYGAESNVAGLTYRWDFSNGDSSATATPIVRTARPVSAMPVRAHLTATNGCFTRSDTVTVAPPLRFQVAFGVLNDNNTVCSGDTVKLVDNSVGATSYRVTLGDGTRLTELPPFLVLTNSTDEVIAYPIVLEGSNGNCPDQRAVDTVLVRPVTTEAAFALDFDGSCSPAQVELTNLASPGASSTVLWDARETPQIVGEGDTLVHIYRNARDTVYEIRMVSRLCGVDTFTRPFAVSAGADATFALSDPGRAVCVGNSVSFAYGGEVGEQSLIYDFGDGSFSLTADPTHEYTAVGTYTVTLSVTNRNGCRAVDSLQVRVGEYTGPALGFDIPREVCVDAPFRFDPGSLGTQFSYDYGNGLRSDEPIQRPYQREGRFRFTLTSADAAGCSADTTATVTVHPEFTVEIQPPDEVLTVDIGDPLDLSFQMMPLRLVDSIRWWGDSLSNRDVQRTTASPVADGFYYLEVTDEYGCLATDSVRVNVIKNYGDRIYVANAFSPNGDGQNETFGIQVKPGTVRAIHSLRVFSRWGDQVYACERCGAGGGTVGWDGRIAGGRPLDPGVYVWVAEIEFVDGQRQIFRGNVSLLR